jgi:hypothetical protein
MIYGRAATATFAEAALSYLENSFHQKTRCMPSYVTFLVDCSRQVENALVLNLPARH